MDTYLRWTTYIPTFGQRKALLSSALERAKTSLGSIPVSLIISDHGKRETVASSMSNVEVDKGCWRLLRRTQGVIMVGENATKRPIYFMMHVGMVRCLVG